MDALRPRQIRAAGRFAALFRRPSRAIGPALLTVGLILQLWAGHERLAWRNSWFDLLHRLAPREKAADPPAVVADILARVGVWTDGAEKSDDRTPMVVTIAA